MVFNLSAPVRIAQGGTLFLCRLLNHVWDSYRARAAWQRSLDDLRDLDDAKLRDVGLSRTDQKRGYPEF
ncbi:MAG: hypothetical protein VW600_19955 [Ferrovibrio sp.]